MSTVILGGGVSGLSAAYYRLQFHPKQAIQLIESSNRVGGWIKSSKLPKNILFEQGPRTIRPTGLPGINTLSLIEELGLQDEIVPIPATAPAAKNRMIYAKGQLHSLPSSVTQLFRTQKPFSKPLFLHILQDLYTPKVKSEDESIYDFVSRRFGTEFADYLISPLICGICAGNSKEISVKFLMSNFFEYEQKYGSITKGIIKNIWARSFGKPNLSGLALKAKKEKWNIYSFKQGLESLPKALEDYIIKNDVKINLNTKCKKIEINSDRINVELEDGTKINPSRLISSVPSEQLSKLLENQHPELSSLLQKIKNVSVVVINLQYDKKVLAKEGFGFLIPPKEKLPLLGVIYDSCFFPNKENTVLTVMMGGAWFEQWFGKDPDKNFLLETALKHLKSMMGINEKPVESKVNILEKCIPQYTVGHSQNVQKINSYIKERKLPLSLCGTSYYGVGVNDVILSAKNAAQLF